MIWSGKTPSDQPAAIIRFTDHEQGVRDFGQMPPRTWQVEID
jgi:hypothetical protein